MNMTDYTTALGLAIAKANLQMTERGAQNWSLEDDRLYRTELARLTGEPLIIKPWDEEACGTGHTYFDNVCVRCGIQPSWLRSK
jgi:hypothetical protein